VDRLPKHECITLASLDWLIRTSQPGEQFIYATDNSGNAFANSNRDDVPAAKTKLFTAARAAQRDGKVMLFQRHDRHIVNYIAIRVSPRTLEFVERLAKNAG
jgi:hypothetical protein